MKTADIPKPQVSRTRVMSKVPTAVSRLASVVARKKRPSGAYSTSESVRPSELWSMSMAAA